MNKLNLSNCAGQGTYKSILRYYYFLIKSQSNIYIEKINVINITLKKGIFLSKSSFSCISVSIKFNRIVL